MSCKNPDSQDSLRDLLYTSSKHNNETLTLVITGQPSSEGNCTGKVTSDRTTLSMVQWVEEVGVGNWDGAESWSGPRGSQVVTSPVHVLLGR